MDDYVLKLSARLFVYSRSCWARSESDSAHRIAHAHRLLAATTAIRCQTINHNKRTIQCENTSQNCGLQFRQLFENFVARSC